MREHPYEEAYQATALKEGARQISYDQFVKIKHSGERFLLLDVLPEASYKNGHIESAASFPVGSIDRHSAGKRLSKDSRIIVYCASFDCHASTIAAKKLSDLGYTALDYKGGLKEWQEKGNSLIK